MTEREDIKGLVSLLVRRRFPPHVLLSLPKTQTSTGSSCSRHAPRGLCAWLELFGHGV